MGNRERCREVLVTGKLTPIRPCSVRLTASASLVRALLVRCMLFRYPAMARSLSPHLLLGTFVVVAELAM